MATSLDMNNQAVNDTGYFGVVFEHLETGTLFISHRGTEWTESGDLANDWSIMRGKALSQFGAVDQFESWLRHPNNKINVEIKDTYSSGHSLGKVLSDYALVKHGALSSQGISGPGSREVLEDAGLTITADHESRIFNFYENDDPIANFGPQIGTVETWENGEEIHTELSNSAILMTATNSAEYSAAAHIVMLQFILKAHSSGENVATFKRGLTSEVDPVTGEQTIVITNKNEADEVISYETYTLPNIDETGQYVSPIEYSTFSRDENGVPQINGISLVPGAAPGSFENLEWRMTVNPLATNLDELMNGYEVKGYEYDQNGRIVVDEVTGQPKEIIYASSTDLMSAELRAEVLKDLTQAVLSGYKHGWTTLPDDIKNNPNFSEAIEGAPDSFHVVQFDDGTVGIRMSDTASGAKRRMQIGIDSGGNQFITVTTTQGGRRCKKNHICQRGQNHAGLFQEYRP
ncbi:hypothetical protein [Luteithermobacter gelatinilyticus]|uniref:hypothetical protein n=1 Tax=Luteithermobacter gelatinilyticus TaxID=2582913 RepID=UPI00110720EF|nr:hypothetical protein [Luteithermobacter gelatinilyticus]